MRTLLILALLVPACGHRAFLDLTDATAVREPDDRVAVTTTLECDNSMMGVSDCSSTTEVCIEARWLAAGATDAVATARECSREIPAPHHPTKLALRSAAPVPSSPLAIHFVMSTTVGEGTPVQERNVFEQRAGKTLTSP